MGLIGNIGSERNIKETLIKIKRTLIKVKKSLPSKLEGSLF